MAIVFTGDEREIATPKKVDAVLVFRHYYKIECLVVQDVKLHPRYRLLDLSVLPKCEMSTVSYPDPFPAVFSYGSDRFEPCIRKSHLLVEARSISGEDTTLRSSPDQSVVILKQRRRIKIGQSRSFAVGEKIELLRKRSGRTEHETERQR